jgi:Icc-related predicted phosphoesterase
MKLLTLSDTVEDIIYNPGIGDRYGDIDMIIGCGDLPYYYLEYVVSKLDVPLYFVRGNHANVIEHSSGGGEKGPKGGVDLHRRVINHNGLLLAGVEGCLRYRRGPFLYSQYEMWTHVLALTPTLLYNRIFYGRYLDILITHAAPLGIHDQTDLPHQGINAFRWIDKVFHPAYHFHGHIHVYRPDTVTETQFEDTLVINTYGHRVVDVDLHLPSDSIRGD